jgi:uncharacterized repeat protein (TIGR01451 family)
VASTTTDPVSTNDSATQSTTVSRSADLSLTKIDSPDPVLAGGTLTYTLSVKNNGPSDASGVTLTDPLPGNVTHQSSTPSQGTCSESSGTVTCSLGTLAAGDTATVEIRVTPQGPASITNTASVQANEPDASSTNNSATASTTSI